MSDELQQLLRHADTTPPRPRLTRTIWPAKSVAPRANHRRLSACGLAILLLLICTPLLFRHRTHAPDSSIPVSAIAITQFDAEVHARTAALLMQFEKHPKVRVDPTDAFLADLTAQRTTSPPLLHDADRQLRSDNRTAAVTTLRGTIALFPETPAASALLHNSNNSNRGASHEIHHSPGCIGRISCVCGRAEPIQHDPLSRDSLRRKPTEAKRNHRFACRRRLDEPTEKVAGSDVGSGLAAPQAISSPSL